MQQISIPDPFFAEATRRAKASGVSLERYVMDALRLHFEDEYDGPKATPELIATLRQADADIDAGKGLTMEQVRANLAANRTEWLQNHSR
ncbi:MAG: hypothetical protein EOP09_03555 [Proteobacteria bacterium]|nr:MAG: hypothetical protein EOP09_03555 [Pseudomonadota bacterium]